ncbi:MAG: glycoside hydrolase family 3 C-terminal domain-containing protein [Candidatus Marinimicrobia bacterium]|nr:glycoside hydrolase family 3 C-terminal domain-containing protein [Candidatus Neomarinimicrobiota bacterium]
MKKLLKSIGWFLLILLIIAISTFSYFHFRWNNQAKTYLNMLGPEAPILVQDSIQYRDLNKNHKLDIYENRHASIEERVKNLLLQMTLEEKSGLMFITMIGMKSDGSTMEKPILFADRMTVFFSFLLKKNAEMVASLNMSHFNTIQNLPAEIMATWNNNIQKMAERTRLGIPVTIATDPRHGPGGNPGANVFTEDFSHWPTALGLAATRDTLLVREFGDIARQEYTAVGIRLALSPMADLATEPRWGRIAGTFGEEAELSAQMTKAYIQGFQGDYIDQNSVLCMTKHFAGGGPQKDGEDAHFPYGKDQVYPGDNFEYHLIPFEKGAFPANTAQIMPYYGIPVGITSEDVGFSFNRDIITTLLRKKYKFDGVVCTDWNIITDSRMGEGRAWGVENLSPLQRVKKVLDAGCDQFGGEASPELVMELVRSRQISEDRIDESVRRLLYDKFQLGLFDNPYVNVEHAGQFVGNSEFVRKGKLAQMKSTILLKNERLLPLTEDIKVYVENINTMVAAQYGTIVESIEDADVIIIRLNTPYDPRSEFMLEQFFHQGRLYFNHDEKQKILDLIRQKPSVIGITLERPAIITEIAQEAEALIADFGTEDDVFLDIVFGLFNPTGKLPFEMPSSQEAVDAQLEDIPYDSKNPLFPFGYGLTYTKFSNK